MYNYDITTQEISDFNADMAELMAEQLPPTDEELKQMAKWYEEVY